MKKTAIMQMNWRIKPWQLEQIQLVHPRV